MGILILMTTKQIAFIAALESAEATLASWKTEVEAIIDQTKVDIAKRRPALLKASIAPIKAQRALESAMDALSQSEGDELAHVAGLQGRIDAVLDERI